MSDYMEQVHREHAERTPEERAAIDEAILAAIDEATGRKVPGTQPWPGLPVGHLRLHEAPAVHDMIRRGVIEEVSRPRVTDPTRFAYFYRRADCKAIDPRT